MTKYDIKSLPTPYFVVDEALLEEKLRILAKVKAATGCKILLAQKGFSMFSMYPTVSRFLDGTCASGLHEAVLAHEYFDGENHVYAPAYSDSDFARLLEICGHIVFNSFDQWQRFKPKENTNTKFGIRINPELSTQRHEKPIYDPCAPFSRLGVTAANFKPELLEGISGLHFHALCQQGPEDLAATVEAVEAKFGKYLHQMEWLNFGGGHHITLPWYDLDKLCTLINRIKTTYGVQVYLEPGEAVAHDTGFLAASVLDIVENGKKIAILDTSAPCHMQDVLEMPYRPHILESGKPGEKPHEYRLGGVSCLAGDIIGDYTFDLPLQRGDRLFFTDMAVYSMVKTTTFNGVNLPSIAILRKNGEAEIVKTFGYDDFKNRLS